MLEFLITVLESTINFPFRWSTMALNNIAVQFSFHISFILSIPL